MSIQKEDYRTNRADYAIAKKPNLIARAEAVAKKKFYERRFAKLTENPSETWAKPKTRPRG
jgi:hypothetical protein